MADVNIPAAISKDVGGEDEYPNLLKKIEACDIFIVGTPIWFGSRSSQCQKLMERLDASLSDTDDKGQTPFYNKVAGIVVTGNEDGAHNAGWATAYNLMHLGFTIPPNCDTYWVGEAGPGPSYMEAGEDHLYTNKTLRMLAHNTAFFARLLKDNPIPTNLKELIEDAKKVSKES